MNSNTEYLILTIPIVIIFIVWLFVRGKETAKGVIVLTWLILMVTLAFVGASLWEETHESSQLGSAIALTSTMWLVGPFLVFTAYKSWGFIWSLLGCILLPFLSLVICFYILAVSGQIWGM